MVSQLINANPVVYEIKDRPARVRQPARRTSTVPTPSTSRRFLISFPRLKSYQGYKDPEHPYTLEELKVVSEDAIDVDDKQSHVRVTFTPTVEHCSMATLIGLSIRVKLMRSLPSRFKVDIRVAPGTHATEDAVNKQLNDKERVAAALENPNLVDMVEGCLSKTYI
ncbi:unnamed protein product [Spirodela intermedia]|uniref:MIP18 family-like domain-containing protein n=1 Tax=Spirodela intermedia TaxID=51605 RepID=A0A7I8JHI3_SPIIN|nr:unnamed protein product [Spirodela intermedia]CAA6669620.1 unnamed protein product [Spirodela intermedia]